MCFDQKAHSLHSGIDVVWIFFHLKFKLKRLHAGQVSKTRTQSTQDAGLDKQMGPVDVNGGIHTARKQHQRKNVEICARVVSRVLCGLGLEN